MALPKGHGCCLKLAKAKRALEAMMQITKIDTAAIEAARRD